MSDREKTHERREFLLLLLLGIFVFSAFALGYIQRELDWDERSTIRVILGTLGDLFSQIVYGTVHPPLHGRSGRALRQLPEPVAGALPRLYRKWLPLCR